MKALLCASLCAAALGCQATPPPLPLALPPRLVDTRPSPSWVFTDLELPTAGVESVLEQALPRVLNGRGRTSLGGLGAIDLEWQLRRSPLSLEGTPDGMALRSRVVGDVSAALGIVGCRASGLGVEIAISAQPTLTGSGDLVLANPRATAHPIGSFNCAGIDVPVQALMGNILRVPLRGLESAVRLIRVPLGPLLRAGREALRVPLDAEVAGHKVCLDLAPRGWVLAPLAARSASGPAGVTARIGLEVRPRVSLATCAAAREHFAPPEPAAPDDRILVRTVALASAYQLQAAVAVPYERLASELVGRVFGDGGHQLTIRAAKVSGVQNRVLVSLDVAGAVKGTLYLWGTPAVVLSRDGRYLLTVPDLQVSLPTAALLDRLKLGAWRLWNGGLAASLRDKVAVDLTERLRTISAGLSGERRVGDAVLISELTELVPVAVTSGPATLVAFVTLVGRARIIVK